MHDSEAREIPLGTIVFKSNGEIGIFLGEAIWLISGKVKSARLLTFMLQYNTSVTILKEL